MIDVKMEDIANEPRLHLNNIIEFIGAKTTPQYLSDCSRIINKPSAPKRNLIKWDNEKISKINLLIENVDFLKGCKF